MQDVFNNVWGTFEDARSAITDVVTARRGRQVELFLTAPECSGLGDSDFVPARLVADWRKTVTASASEQQPGESGV